MPQSKAWKDFERKVASIWGSYRVPLSGINSRHNAGDVILPQGISALLECKTRQNSAHWELFKDAQDDAIKNKINPLHTILFFKKKGANGYIVTMDGKLFEKILPFIRHIFTE